jgi:hypothetical protein
MKTRRQCAPVIMLTARSSTSLAVFLLSYPQPGNETSVMLPSHLIDPAFVRMGGARPQVLRLVRGPLDANLSSVVSNGTFAPRTTGGEAGAGDNETDAGAAAAQPQPVTTNATAGNATGAPMAAEMSNATQVAGQADLRIISLKSQYERTQKANNYA